MRGNFRPSHPNRRPAPPPPRKPARPPGPAVIAPKSPKSGKERRKMLKATTHRLARVLRSSCAALQKMDSDAIFALIRTRLGTGYCCGAGEARRLAKKCLRLRNPSATAGQAPA